ncbi:hypothetical protein K493DRAFT_332934 [Basidiobolus meristosporus CBS 931.73]|uniref:Uncharacterized protein n=1 Tax=Basidiobolus meristosporus CBS 931.73 TaxID=1314790 RepID=A0A1Y1ZB26_9FUNG|nr:hypothetical protein K493DRAFT_332934 [Basidiobolus meristosporus CBS 931.73]|eukprot:ORY06985.1 hypothetical protein K493DRAFT_332934 [Basidiobolus meristosporus CBS 931.73]
MMQRPRFNSYSAGSPALPLTENQALVKHRYLIKKQYKSHDLLKEAINTNDAMKSEQPGGHVTLNRRASKLRRLSSLLNKKFNRNRLSRDKISPPILVTASSFIEAVPIENPAKELSSLETPNSTSHLSEHSNQAGLPGQLSRQSSKSSSHTLQRQLSDREIKRLGSRGFTKHTRFLSESSLSSFTSDGSSDKHSSYGRENIVWPLTVQVEHDWELENAYSTFPVLSDSFTQQATDWEMAALAEVAISESLSNPKTPENKPTNTKPEIASLARNDLLRSNSLPISKDKIYSHRFSGPDTEVESIESNAKRRVKSECGMRGDVSLDFTKCRVRSSSLNPVKTKWREAVIYAKDLEDYESVLSEMEIPVTNSNPISEASILEFLSSLSPSSSEDSSTETANSSPDLSSAENLDLDPEAEAHDDLYDEAPSSSTHATTEHDTYRHSIFDLYCYDSDEEEYSIESDADDSSDNNHQCEYSGIDTPGDELIELDRI